MNISSLYQKFNLSRGSAKDRIAFVKRCFAFTRPEPALSSYLETMYEEREEEGEEEKGK